MRYRVIDQEISPEHTLGQKHNIGQLGPEPYYQFIQYVLGDKPY